MSKTSLDTRGTVLTPEFWRYRNCYARPRDEFPFDGFLETLRTGKLPQEEAN